MSLRLDLVWQDDEAVQFHASCADCSFQSEPFHDEETARASWFGHVCVRPGSLASS